MTRDYRGDWFRRYTVKPRKPSTAELEALVRWRERALEEAKKQLRESRAS
jgi:hypothetical protein